MDNVPQENQPAFGRGALGRRAFLGAVGGVAATGAATLLVPSLAGASGLPGSMLPPEASALVSFSKIDGTPVYYWRSSHGNTKPVTWRCTQKFLDTLVVWIRELRKVSKDAGYGNIDYLVSAGFYVDKGGQHGKGTAIDLDVVKWSRGQTSSMLNGDHKSSNQALARRYLAVEATLRRQFCYVLDGWYPNHADHFHADFASMPPLLNTGSNSATYFIQASCNRFLGSSLTIDGKWGPKTQQQYDRMRNKLGISGDPTKKLAVYRTMLNKIALHGFRNTAF